MGTSAQASEWQFDTALMYYSETDRVSAVEGIVAGTREYKDSEFLSLKLTIDSLSGASANGAVAQPFAQTFSRPSGNGTYNVDANETPLDDTFKDTRVQVNGSWSQPWKGQYTVSTGFHVSKEYDYLSLGGNGSISRDFDKKNTTLAIGVGYFYDEIEPEGGIPKPLATLPFVLPSTLDNYINPFKGDTNDQYRIASSDNKSTIDALFGLTQVINRRAIMQLNYSLSIVDGYLIDPFKIVSVVDDLGLAQNQIYEKRPDSRTKQSVYWQSKYHFSKNIIDFSYRYMWDDWEIDSHTFDLRYRIELAQGYLEPHARYYMQEAAEFYQPFVNQSQPLPDYVSADYRIGEMNAYTIGIKYGRYLGNNNEWSFRLEYYQQDPKNPGVEMPGVLAQQDLFESVKAIIGQASYSF